MEFLQHLQISRFQFFVEIKHAAPRCRFANFDMTLEPRARQSQISIAIAEDHHATAEGLTSWFARSSDFRVIGTCASRDALEMLLASAKPDLVLMDMHMPGERGLKDIISHVRDSGVKIVVFSADNRPFFVQLALDCGVQAFLLKSEPFQTISDVLRRVHAGEVGITSQKLTQHDVRITDTEKDILILLAEGLKYSEIAERRRTTSETIRKQCDKIIAKLQLANREELIVWALKHGYTFDRPIQF